MLKELVEKKKSSILDKWVEKTLDSYPPESLNFLKSQKDRFANPIGYAISNNAAKLFDEVIGDDDPHKIDLFLDDIIKIRAVQDFTPAQAVGFVFFLKDVIREQIVDEIRDAELVEDLMKLESRIDNVALAAFDLYMQSREKIFQIRVNEVKARSLQAILQKEGGDNHNRVEHNEY